MGLFSTRPEEPTEWAGLPSEPAHDRTEAESLAAQTESADSLAFLGTTIESIVIPVAPAVDVPPSAADSAEGDRPA